MKKTFLIATALIAGSIAAIAAPLNPKGIPADSQGIVYIDFEACSKSEFGSALKKYSEKALASNADKQKQYEDFKKQTGVDITKDVTSVTISLFQDSNNGKSPKGAAILRGNFAVDKIVSAAKANKCVVTKEGTLTLIDCTALAEKNEDGEKSGSVPYAGIVDANTIIVAEAPAHITKVAGALSGKDASYALPATLSTFSSQESNPFILAYVGDKLTPAESNNGPMAVSKAKCYLIALSESGANLHARVFSEYADEESAKKMQKTVQSMLGFVQMMSAQAQGDDAQNLQQLLAGLKTNIRGNSFDITLDFPSMDALKAIEKYSNRMAAPKPDAE